MVDTRANLSPGHGPASNSVTASAFQSLPTQHRPCGVMVAAGTGLIGAASGLTPWVCSECKKPHRTPSQDTRLLIRGLTLDGGGARTYCRLPTFHGASGYPRAYTGVNGQVPHLVTKRHLLASPCLSDHSNGMVAHTHCGGMAAEQCSSISTRRGQKFTLSALLWPNQWRTPMVHP